MLPKDTLKQEETPSSENSSFHQNFFNDKFILLYTYLVLRGHYSQPGRRLCIIKSTICLNVLEKGRSIFFNLVSKFLATKNMMMGHGMFSQTALSQLKGQRPALSKLAPSPDSQNPRKVWDELGAVAASSISITQILIFFLLDSHGPVFIITF